MAKPRVAPEKTEYLHRPGLAPNLKEHRKGCAMAIPTKEQFDEVINAIAKLRATELADDARKMTVNEEAMLSLLQKCRVIIKLKTKQIHSLYAMDWLWSQQYGQEAINKYSKHYKHIKGLSDNELVKSICKDITTEYVQQRIQEDRNFYEDRVRRYGSIEGYVAYNNSEERKTELIRAKLIWKIQAPRQQWIYGVFTSLRNYYYTNRWADLVAENKSKITKLKSALDALESLRSLTTDLIAPTSLGMGPKSYARMRFTIENKIKADVASIYPVERNDKTARERVLAYDLYLNNEREFNEPKTSIIHCLMNLDGIENKIGQRALDGLISKWREARNEYNEKMKEAYEDEDDVVGYYLEC